ncbi:MAG: hypothetical protein ABI818_04365 [Acidobacteriota bacterium]
MKPLFIILALIGVIFLGILFASRANDQGFDPATDRPPALVTIVGSVLRRWSPTVKFAQHTYTVSGAPVVVDVPAGDDPGDTYRTAPVRVAPPNCPTVTITYKARDGEGEPQTWHATEADPCAGTFVVGPTGGTLTMACAPLQVCSIELGS